MKSSLSPADTTIHMTELVLPQHTNQLGNLLGGQLMHWIDICAALAGYKLNGRVCVTASVDRIDFHHPIRLGEVVTLVSSVNRAFHTSMEIGVKVFRESFAEKSKLHTNSAYLTFVSVDKDGLPVVTAQILPVSEEEKRRYDQALERRTLRLQNRSREK